MIDECKKHIDNKKIKLINSDIASINIENCSVVILNLTLQFIPKNKRTLLLKIFQRLEDSLKRSIKMQILGLLLTEPTAIL